MHLTTDNSQHRPNGRESIFIASPSRVPCSCKAKANASICRQRSGSAPKRGGESVTRRLKFRKRGQLFIRLHNVTLSVVAMRVCNPDCSPLTINGQNAAPTPTGFAEIVSDDFPVLHANLGMFDVTTGFGAIRMIVITINGLAASNAIAFCRPSTETTTAVRFGSTEITLSNEKALCSFLPTNTNRLFVMVRCPVSSFAHCCVLNERPLVPPT